MPDTAQGSLGWGGASEAEGAAGATKKILCGGTAFRGSTPWHLCVGDERLDQYLSARGMGWVVRPREELQALDCSDLEANYTGTGHAPYHPRTMLGLIIYGTLKRKSTLREGARALDNGASLEEVQRAAGHADATTTKLYWWDLPGGKRHGRHLFHRSPFVAWAGP